MCGIFAISGKSDSAGAEVIKGLKKLEYRGYDSWGVAVKTTIASESETANNAICIEKNIGKISEVDIEFPTGVEAMGHSRWATHGGVTQENAHPHVAGKVVLVHNGVCENYETLKAEFSDYNFISETDSEVIAVLVNSYFEETGDPILALQKTAERLEGRFAILVMYQGIKGVFAARRGSPLIIGRGEGETFIASDIPAFLEKTKTVNYLDDDQIVRIEGSFADFYDLKTGESIQKRNIVVPWQVEDAEKGEYPHFMIKEIFDQKETIERSINHDEDILQKAVELIQSCDGSYLIACGTSHKVAMAAEYFFSNIAGKKVNVVPASEMNSFQRFINKKTCLIAISQSGETADIMEVIEEAQARDAKILSLTNVESSSLSRTADVNLPLNAGPEKAVASTKAATAQMALLFLLAHAIAGEKEKSADFFRGLNRGREILRDTASSINDLLNPRYEDHVRSVAEKMFEHDKIFIIGRNTLYPMALEASIKIQEVSYISAMGFAAGELKHGPIALIEQGTPCVVLGGDQETVSNAIELQARGARIIGIAPEKAAVFDDWIKVPDCDGAQSIASIIPVQILAYHLAIFRGLDPDMPRNLAKSVTVK